jgi:hypothetical protein
MEKETWRKLNAEKRVEWNRRCGEVQKGTEQKEVVSKSRIRGIFL